MCISVDQWSTCGTWYLQTTNYETLPKKWSNLLRSSCHGENETRFRYKKLFFVSQNLFFLDFFIKVCKSCNSFAFPIFHNVYLVQKCLRYSFCTDRFVDKCLEKIAIVSETISKLHISMVTYYLSVKNKHEFETLYVQWELWKVVTNNWDGKW